MKMQILRNAKGEIVAAFEKRDGELVSVEAQPDIGDELEEMEVSESLKSEQAVLELYQHLARRVRG